MNKARRWLRTFHYPSYVIFFVTARCNASCKMCFYKENMDSNVAKDELTLSEYDRISQGIPFINVLGISGGEPFLRHDLHEIVKILYRNCAPVVVDLPTNGYFPQEVVRQVKVMAEDCPKMTIDCQLSIDGPEAIHDEIRGLKNGFQRMRDTYLELVGLKKHYRNLKLKACVVYSHYNQDHMPELFAMLDRDFPDFDRVVFSVAHGSVANPQVMDFDWQKYFGFCENFRRTVTVQRVLDVHSLLTIALRIAKNDFLKKILQSKDMYRKCRAGQRVIVINEIGQVFPCEPLWQPVGNLRQNGYDLQEVLDSETMQEFQDQIKRDCCNCHWGLPMSNTILFSPRYYPLLLGEMFKIVARSLRAPKKGSGCR